MTPVGTPLLSLQLGYERGNPRSPAKQPGAGGRRSRRSALGARRQAGPSMRSRRGLCCLAPRTQAPSSNRSCCGRRGAQVCATRAGPRGLRVRDPGPWAVPRRGWRRYPRPRGPRPARWRRRGPGAAVHGGGVRMRRRRTGRPGPASAWCWVQGCGRTLGLVQHLSLGRDSDELILLLRSGAGALSWMPS